MPSEQRLHPVSILFGLGASLKALALPALLVLFTSSSSGRGPGGVLGMPQGNFSNAAFGRVSSQANNPRQGQLALRLEF